MNLSMLKCKLHRAVVTHAELAYDGSCAIDQDLLEAAGLLPFERLEIYNINNGERFATYAIVAERGSGIISMNGAAARKVAVTDRVIICAYVSLDANEAATHNPRLIYLDDKNQIDRTSGNIPTQLAAR
jgi:aspartate 1-decarboxylase